jgi:hypothetical protein
MTRTAAGKMIRHSNTTDAEPVQVSYREMREKLNAYIKANNTPELGIKIRKRRPSK